MTYEGIMVQTIHRNANHRRLYISTRIFNLFVSCVSSAVTLTPIMTGECVIINLCWLQCQSKITLGEESSPCSIGAKKDNSINLTLLKPHPPGLTSLVSHGEYEQILLSWFCPIKWHVFAEHLVFLLFIFWLGIYSSWVKKKKEATVWFVCNRQSN